jgi:hypothetical protein
VVVGADAVATTTELSWVAVSVEAELAVWVSAVDAIVEVLVLVSVETVS